MTVSLIPIGYLMYQFTGPGNYEHKYFTRVINSYDHYRKDAAHINALHTDALEQAAADRNLFANTQRTQNVQLKFPEYVRSSKNTPTARHGESGTSQKEKKAKRERTARKTRLKRIERLTKFCQQDPQHWSPSQCACRPLCRHVAGHCKVREGVLRGQRKEAAADQGQRRSQRAPFQGQPSHWRPDCVDVEIYQANREFTFLLLYLFHSWLVCEQKCCCHSRQASHNSIAPGPCRIECTCSDTDVR